MSIAQWAVRKHVEFVASFDFHGRNDDESLNQQIERLMEEDSKPSRADVSGRFGREKLFRLAEARRLLDGDCLLVMLNDGRMQGIQADLIRDPRDTEKDETWVNGVRIGRVGRHLAYGIYRRTSDTNVEFARRVSSMNCLHHGFFDRFAGDQVRGISPMVSALASLQDVYEGITLALAKQKVAQMFALSFYRGGNDKLGGDLGLDESGAADDIGNPVNYKVNLGTDPMILDLAPGDRAEFLESRQPSTEFQSFTMSVIQAALKAIEIPISFYDESWTNFFGSRAAWLHYERSCSQHRMDQIEMRRRYTLWKLATWVRDGRLILPRSWRVSDVAFEWVPKGMPFWDPAKEIRGHVAAIKAGLDTPQRICRASGSDYFSNIDAIRRAREYAEENGVPIDFAMEPEITIQTSTSE